MHIYPFTHTYAHMLKNYTFCTHLHIHTACIQYVWEHVYCSTYERQRIKCTTNPDGVAVFSVCGWKLAEGKNALAKTECLCHCTVCPVALQPASTLFPDSWRECESMSSICAYMCVYSKCAGLDPHTLLLIKRTRRQSGVSATPGGMGVSGGREVTVSVCVCTWFLRHQCVRVCAFLWVCLLFVYTSVISAACFKKLHLVFPCQLFIVKWNHKEKKTQKEKKTPSLVHFVYQSMHLHRCVWVCVHACVHSLNTASKWVWKAEMSAPMEVKVCNLY